MPTTTARGPVRSRPNRPPNRLAHRPHSHTRWTRSRGLDIRIALSTPGVQVVGGVSNTWIVHRFQNGVSRSIANQVFNQIESQAQGGVLVAESAQVLTRLLERYLSPPGAVLAPADHSPLWQSSSSNVA